MTSGASKTAGANDESTIEGRRRERVGASEGRHAIVDERRHRSSQAVSPPRYHPRQSSPKGHSPRHSAHRRDGTVEYEPPTSDRNRDLVVALRSVSDSKKSSNDNKSRCTPKATPAMHRGHSGFESSSRKRRLSKEHSEVDVRIMNKQPKLASEIVLEAEPKDADKVVPEHNAEIPKVADCTKVKDVAMETVNNNKDVAKPKNLASIELSGMNDSLTLEDYNVYCLDEENKEVTGDCYEELLDYGGSEERLQIDALFGDKNEVTEKELVPGYPFRYNISSKAQKQINDIIYADVVVAVSSIQRTLGKVVEEKCVFESRCKELEGLATLKASEVEEKFRSQIEDAEKKLILKQDEYNDLKKLYEELKKLHASDQDFFSDEIHVADEREKLALEQTQQAERNLLLARAESAGKTVTITNLRQRIDELCKLLEKNRIEIPPKLNATLPKGRQI